MKNNTNIIFQSSPVTEKEVENIYKLQTCVSPAYILKNTGTTYV